MTQRVVLNRSRRAPSRSSALGKRVSKSSTPTHSGRGTPDSSRCHGAQVDEPGLALLVSNMRLVISSYSGATPSTVSVRIRPRTWSTR